MGSMFDRTRRNMDALFSEKNLAKSFSSCWRPAVDVYELVDKIVVIVDLAGVKAEAIDITMANGILSIRGSRKDPAPDEILRVHQMEIDRGRFDCRIFVGIPVRVIKIEAVQKDGYLTIELPKE